MTRSARLKLHISSNSILSVKLFSKILYSKLSNIIACFGKLNHIGVSSLLLKVIIHTKAFTIVSKCEPSEPKISPESKNFFFINENYAELASRGNFASTFPPGLRVRLLVPDRQG